MTVIKLKITNLEDQENMVKALALNGYKTWIEVEKKTGKSDEHFVCFEYEEGKK